MVKCAPKEGYRERWYKYVLTAVTLKFSKTKPDVGSLLPNALLHLLRLLWMYPPHHNNPILAVCPIIPAFAVAFFFPLSRATTRDIVVRYGPRLVCPPSGASSVATNHGYTVVANRMGTSMHRRTLPAPPQLVVFRLFWIHRLVALHVRRDGDGGSSVVCAVVLSSSTKLLLLLLLLVVLSFGVCWYCCWCCCCWW